MKDSNDFYARMSANELADYLEKWFTEPYVSDTVAMLRQQTEELIDAGGMISVLREKLAQQTKPLSDEEIHDIWKSLWECGNIGHIAYNYARAIEERHGIK